MLGETTTPQDLTVLKNGTLTFQEANPDFFTPVGDRYLCEELDVENGYFTDPADGKRLYIHLPEQTKEQRGWLAGKVVRVGNGARLENETVVPMYYKPGDIVMCERMSGRFVVLQGKRYFVISQVEILGRFN